MSEEMFKAPAEKMAEKFINENEIFVNRLHMLEFALEEMSRDPKMTKSAWQRAIKGMHQMRKNQETLSDKEKVKYQHEIEKAVAENMRNQTGLIAHMMLKQDAILEQAKREMAQMKKIVEDRQKAALEAQNQTEFKFETEKKEEK